MVMHGVYYNEEFAVWCLYVNDELVIFGSRSECESKLSEIDSPKYEEAI
jgi:hypothetical protein